MEGRTTWEGRCPAKVNLGLRILGRRPDGYHELDGLMLPISLCDDLCLELGGQDIRVHCPGHPELDGADNLAGKAARLWLDARGASTGLSIRINKKIPAQAGLGGGSSDAAWVLRALNQLLDPLPQARLEALALKLGADVPFFLQDGPCRARGVGERLEPVEHLPRIWLILATAPFGLGTRDVFQSHTFPLTIRGENDSNYAPHRGFVELASALQNDLQAVAIGLRPSIGRVCERLTEAGAHGVTMSGSGPSVVGLFPTRSEARQAIKRMHTETGWKYQVVKGITSVLASRSITT